MTPEGYTNDRSKEDIADFLKVLKDTSTQTPNPGTGLFPEVEGFEPEELKALMEKIPNLLMKMVELVDAGPDASTPLAVLLDEPAIASIIFSLSMSPMHTDLQKARMIAAITIIGLKEYNIVI